MDRRGHQHSADSTTGGDDHQRRPASYSIRGANSRRVIPGNRARALATAISRLEQEHVALLLALCDLEESSANSQDAVMRGALRQLLRDDLRRTQHALRRAAQGSYGICEVCQQPLSRRHLSLLPAITRCWACTGRMPHEHQAHV
ncbi:MAG TPA: hypothetical protein VF040_06990 [Ktedonobacterales bacterium]